MPGKQAKILSDSDVSLMLHSVQANRYPTRDKTLILLSVKAGLRAGEIAGLSWQMVVDPHGMVMDTIDLHDRVAKKGQGRRIPMHPDLRNMLARLREEQLEDNGVVQGAVIRSERLDREGRPQAMTAASVVNWFASLYDRLGLVGCSSHSGRRTFVTRMAKNVTQAGGSLRDVQHLAGHRSIDMTQRYIEGDTDAQRRLVSLI